MTVALVRTQLPELFVRGAIEVVSRLALVLRAEVD